MSAAVIDRATVADLDAIDAISQASVPGSWPRQAYADELTRPHATVDVARVAGAVVGFAVTWAVAGEVELLVIATDPARRRQGVGHALMAAVCAAADGAGARLIALEVRAGNAAARALYARHGFAVATTRRAYYADGEDAVVMIRPGPGPGA